MLTNYQTVIQQSMSPINKLPTIENTTVGTTPAVLLGVAFGSGTHATRRNVRLVNKHSTAILAVLFYASSTLDAGITGSGHTIANGMQIRPGDTVEFAYDATLRLGIVSDTAATGYSALAWIP